MTDNAPAGGFVDDVVAVPDDAVVFRRVFPDFVDWSVVDDAGRPRLTGGAFQDYSESVARERYGLPGACMSVGVAAILSASHEAPEKMLEGYSSEYGLARLRAGDLRTLSKADESSAAQGVMLNATDAEPWHAVVFSKVSTKKNKTIQAAIAAVAVWEIVPDRPTQP